nr:MAG TPA: hypothetical protein [Caudoviricetes sp.]
MLSLIRRGITGTPVIFPCDNVRVMAALSPAAPHLVHAIASVGSASPLNSR